MLNQNIVQRMKMTMWEQCKYLQRLVSQDINNDPKGIKLYDRTYFGRFLILGGFRWINSLKPTGIKMQDLMDEQLYTVRLINGTLADRYSAENYLAHNFQFIRHIQDRSLDNEEMFFLKCLDEAVKVRNERYKIARLIVLGARFQITHGKHEFNRQSEIDQDKERTYQLANRYLNQVFDKEDFNKPFDKEDFELFNSITARPLAHLH